MRKREGEREKERKKIRERARVTKSEKKECSGRGDAELGENASENQGRERRQN